MAQRGRKLDHHVERYVWYYTVSSSESHRLTTCILQGTAQLIVAGAGIYHPDWVATPWQTCVFPIKSPVPHSSLSRRDFPGCHRHLVRILLVLQQVSAEHRRT